MAHGLLCISSKTKDVNVVIFSKLKPQYSGFIAMLALCHK